MTDDALLELEVVRTVACAAPITALSSSTRAPQILVATGRDVTLWRNDGRRIASVAVAGGVVRAVHPLPATAGAEALIGDDSGVVSIVRSFDVEFPVKRLPGLHPGPVCAVAGLQLGADWLAVSMSSDGTLLARGMRSSTCATIAGPRPTRTTALCTVVERGVRLILTGSEDGTVSIWQAAGGSVNPAVVELGTPVTALCGFLKHGSVWIGAGTASGQVVAWALADASSRLVFDDGGAAAIAGLAVLTDSSFPLLAALDASAVLRLWSISNDLCVGRAQLGTVGLAVVEPMGRETIVTGCDASWKALEVDLDRYILDLESEGSGH